MSTITREQIEMYASAADATQTFEMDKGKLICVDPEHMQELARIALASLEAEAMTQVLSSRAGNDTSTIDKALPEGTMLYTAPPAPAFEIKDLEHFISFWKKVQAGQMNPGKNDIDHTVWFLEGLSDLTAPPAPVSMKDHQIRELVNELRDIAVEYHGTQQLRERIARTIRAAMLHGAENIESPTTIKTAPALDSSSKIAESPSSNSPVIPDGYALVPVEPTEDMIVNGFESEPDESFSDEKEWEEYDAMSGCQQAAHRAKLCWAAMLAAAPQQEAKP